MHTTIDSYLASGGLDLLPWELDGEETTLREILQHDDIRCAPVLLLLHRRRTGGLTLCGYESTAAATEDARNVIFGEQAAAAVFERSKDGTGRGFTIAWTLGEVEESQLPQMVADTPLRRTEILQRAVARCARPFRGVWDRRVEFNEGLVPLDGLKSHDARYAILGWSSFEVKITVDLMDSLDELPEHIHRNVWRYHDWIGIWDLSKDRAVEPALAARLVPIVRRSSRKASM